MKEKEYEIISSVLERPGMYVGKARVDYLQHFLNGFLMNGEINNEDSNWRSWSYLLEKWLFYKE